jgi:hypothetical protein
MDAKRSMVFSLFFFSLILKGKNNKLDEERKGLENAEGNWQRQ